MLGQWHFCMAHNLRNYKECYICAYEIPIFFSVVLEDNAKPGKSKQISNVCVFKVVLRTVSHQSLKIAVPFELSACSQLVKKMHCHSQHYK